MSMLRKPVLSLRGTRWQAKIYIGRFDGVSKFAYAYGDTEAEAAAAAYEKMHTLDPVTSHEHGKVTVATWLEQHLKYVAETNKVSTLHRYRQLYQHFILPTLGARLMKHLVPMDILHLHNVMRDKKQSGSSIRAVHFLMNRACNRAKVVGLISSNPCLDVEKPALQHVAPEVFSSETMLDLLDEVKGTFWADPVLLLAHTGLRRGELFGLRQRDVNLNKGTILIGNAVLALGSKLHIETPKTESSYRELGIPPVVVDMLRVRLAKLAALGPNGPVFPNRTGEWQNPNSFSDAIKRHSRKIGVDGWAHLFRHSHASMLLRATGDLAQVSKRLGHANPAITARIYSQAMEKIDHSLGARFGESADPQHQRICGLGAKLWCK